MRVQSIAISTSFYLLEPMFRYSGLESNVTLGNQQLIGRINVSLNTQSGQEPKTPLELFEMFEFVLVERGIQSISE